MGIKPRDPLLIQTEDFQWQPVSLVDTNENPINVQNPLPVSGGSVYCQDLNLELSDIGSFDGDICTLFDDYFINNVAASVGSGGVNPKFFTLVFNRPIQGSTIGVGSPNTTISNAKLTLFGLDGNAVKIVDFSADDTKRGILPFQFEQIIFIKVKIEFFTDDAVTLGGAGITKSTPVSIDAINGVISSDNSSNIPLLANAKFEGTPIDTKNYGIIIVTMLSDVISAVDGLDIQFSIAPTGPWYSSDTFSLEADKVNVLKPFSVQTVLRWMKIDYTNGGTDQGVFLLSTQLKPVYIKPSSHRLADKLSGQDDAELVKSGLLGEDEVSGIFENVQTFSGALKVTDGLVHKAFINNYFTRDTGISSGVASTITSQDRTITVNSAVGFADNDFCNIRENGNTEFTLLKIISISTNDITFNRPIDNDYTTAATLYVVSKNMAVTGSSGSPISFRLTPPTVGANTIWQITRILISMTHSAAGDDGKFGGIAALDNAVLLRTSRSGVFRTATQWFTNGDMKSDMFNVEYSDKAPAGLNGTSGRWTFTESKAVVELIGTENDFAEILIQDDGTGNTTFEIKAQGRIFGV